MKTFIFALITLFPFLSYASGMSSVDSSVSSLAKGGTGVADTSDVASSYNNPANAAFLDGLNVNLEAILTVPGLSVDLDGQEIEPENSAAIPPHLYASYGFDNFTIAYNFNVPFGSAISWPADWKKKYDLQKAELVVLRQSIFAGYNFEGFAFAAGLFLDSAKLNLSRAIDFIEKEGSVEIRTKAKGIGAFAGLSYKVNDNLVLGASYRSNSDLKFEGNADFKRPLELSGKTKDGGVKTQINLPDRLAFGMDLRILEKFNFALDFEYTFWSTYDQLVIDFHEESNSDQVKSKKWENTLAVRFGMAWQGFKDLELRAGAFFDPSPVPDETAGPDSPDSNRLGLSFGLGFEMSKNIQVEAAYQHISFLGREVTDELGQNLEFKGGVHLLGTSFSLKL